MKFTHFFGWMFLLALSLQAFGANSNSMNGTGTNQLHKFYAGGTGAAIWSGDFDGWAALGHLGYHCNTFETGTGALELETGYIHQTKSRSSIGCYQRGSYKNGESQALLARADQYRKGELKMVPLMLNYVFHADLEKCLECESAKDWTFDVGIGVGVNWVQAKNKGSINWVTPKGKIVNVVPLTESKDRWTAIGQVFAHVGYQITPAVTIMGGCRGLLTDKITFGGGTPTAMHTEPWHFLVDLGLEIKL